MARGNLFLGTARGSLGDIVLYRYDSQQVSRVRVRRIKNPQTDAQLVPRIILTTVSKAYSTMIGICEDSFQGYSGPEKNMRRFLKVNNMLLKERVTPEWWHSWYTQSGGNEIGNFNARDTMKMVINDYLISEGDLPQVPYGNFDGTTGLALQAPNGENTTYAQMCEYLGVPLGAQLTYVQLIGDSRTGYVDRCMYSRVILEPASGGGDTVLINDGAIRNPNIKNEGELKVIGSDKGGTYSMYFTIPFTPSYFEQNILGAAFIVSLWEGKAWKRSTQHIKLSPDAGGEPLANIAPLGDALKTWIKAINSDKYLNQADV